MAAPVLNRISGSVVLPSSKLAPAPNPGHPPPSYSSDGEFWGCSCAPSPFPEASRDSSPFGVPDAVVPQAEKTAKAPA